MNRTGSQSKLHDISWLGEVRDVNLSLNPANPIIIRTWLVNKISLLPLANAPYVERHPYCELRLNLKGDLLEFIGAEKIKRPAGSLMLIGPGVPHNALHLSCPHHSIAIHFLPIVLLQMGPQKDGARTLSRFTRASKITERVFRAPRNLRRDVTGLFQEMATEFEEKRSCWEFRLRTLLMEILTHISRWEESKGKVTKVTPDEPNWIQIQKALSFIHQNFSRHIYVSEIAAAAGLTVEGLQTMFRKTHGISCVRYLQSYRILQAKGLLSLSGVRVTEVALSVGFGTLSHFNSAVRKFTGMSPTEYVRKISRNQAN